MRVRKARKLIKRWAYARSRKDKREIERDSSHLLLRAARTIWRRRHQMRSKATYQGLGPWAEVLLLRLNAELHLRRFRS